MNSKVADLSIDEFKKVVREVVMQTFSEMFADPDDGLELQDDFKAELQRSLTEARKGKETISAKDVANKLGLSW